MLSLTKRLLKGFLVAVLGFITGSGCMYLGVGAIGAVGGYMVSPDTVEGVLAAEYQTIWQSSRDVVGKHAVVISEDQTGGRIVADADGTEVILQISPTETRGSWKVSVKSRRNMFPKVRLAQLIYTEIHEDVFN